jgi:hypothetical protein
MTNSDQIEPSDADLQEYLAATSQAEVEPVEEAEEYDLGEYADGEEQADSEGEAKEEEVKPQKSGYVEFSTPEQKARVAEITRKRYEAERETARLKAELEKYKKAPEPPKEVPPPSADPVTEPDVYAKQAQAREAYIREATKFETESSQREQQSAAIEQQKQARLVENYNRNVERLKINPAMLAKAADTCTAYGINKELVNELLEDEDGPAIVAYLGNNIDDLAEVTSMSTAKAIKYIERQVRSKLNVKQTSKAPPPPTKVSGARKADNNAAPGYRFR